MKNGKRLVALLLITVAFFSMPSMAAEKWWQKAAKIFSDTDELQIPDELLPAELSREDIAEAFKQALSIGSEQVVSQLGTVDGFNTDPAIHIPLPDSLSKVKSVLASVGMSQLVDDLELKLNRAAEAATPIAREHFLQAISDMNFSDVMEIYQGPEDSATRYFQQQMSPSLRTQMSPVIAQSLSEVGALQALDNLLGRYQQIPFVPDVSADLTNYVLDKGMDGIFLYMAKEEAAIRENPLKQSTELLKKVFGSK